MDAVLGSAVVAGLMCACIAIIAQYKWKGFFGIVAFVAIGSMLGF